MACYETSASEQVFESTQAYINSFDQVCSGLFYQVYSGISVSVSLKVCSGTFESTQVNI